MSTYNRLELQTLGSQPIMPKNLPDHWPRVVSTFWPCSPSSLKHMSLWCPFVDPYLTTPHSNTGVQIIVVWELGMSFLVSVSWRPLHSVGFRYYLCWHHLDVLNFFTLWKVEFGPMDELIHHPWQHLLTSSYEAASKKLPQWHKTPCDAKHHI